MIHILTHLKKTFPFFGSRAATEDDFYAACDAAGIDVVFTNVVSDGLCILFEGKDYIFLNDKLSGWRLRVMFHELAHCLFHFPSQSNFGAEFFSVHSKHKNHIEAETVAALLKSLRWSDVTLDGRCIKIQSLNSKTPKSRLVPLSSRAVEVLAQRWQNSRKRQSALVFGTSDFKKGFRHACDDAGLADVHFHDLRHTAITRWLAKGMSIADAMKAAGHSQMKTFLRYVNQSESAVYDLALKLDRAA